ncbi:MAG TPA: DUF3048 C-terminal domain-containing protein, partial [Actinomycetota bacterium]|nr:DUF3048 C-terminal domain-containing protein [Actinomycetota bacterium]
FSGANSIVENELAVRGMLVLDEDTSGDALFRVPPGVLEIHNLFANTERLRKLAVKGKVKAPKDDLFEFGDIPDGAKKARRITINFTASNTIEYRWKGGSWKRSEAGLPFMTNDGEQIAVPNVLIQEVQVNNSTRIFDVAGNPSPDISLTGKGRALLFRDGKVVKGTWSSKTEGAMPKLRTKAGDRFTFAEGPIWIELVPAPTGTVKGTLSFR